jgi:PEP-CTERM motif
MNDKRATIRLPVVAALATTGLWSMSAHAEMLLTKTQLIAGTESKVYSFDAPEAGTVTVTLSQLTWPDKLSSLSFAAATSTSVIAQMTQAGTLDFRVSGPGMYSAIVTGTVDASSAVFGLGMWSVKLDFTPAVPLPASAWLLLSGLGGFVVAWRRRPLVSLPPRLARPV